MVSSMVIWTPSETLIVCHELTAWQAVTGERMVYLHRIEALTDATSQSSHADPGRALSRGRPRREKRHETSPRRRDFAFDTGPRSGHQTARVPARAARPRRTPRCAAR